MPSAEDELHSLHVSANATNVVRPRYHELVVTVQRPSDSTVNVVYRSHAGGIEGQRVVMLSDSLTGFVVVNEFDTYSAIPAELARRVQFDTEPVHFIPGSGPEPEDLPTPKASRR